MLVVGMTGGIGSGKSTVATVFRALGVPVVDTDEIAREIVEPGEPALREIRDRFGPTVFDRSGQLDRAALRRRVFDHPEERLALEAILHPKIRETLHSKLDQLNTPYCVVAIPLLLEKSWRSEVDRILVVDAPPNLQVERVTSRDKTNESEARKIIAAQVSREARLAAADDVICNDGSKDWLAKQVEVMHHKYLTISLEKKD